MTDEGYAQSINSNYDLGDLAEAILRGLRATGKDVDALTPADLRAVDQFHIGAHETTLALLRLAAVKPGAVVLDVGGGLGGPARTLALEAGCQVTVLDLTEEFVRVGTMLTARTGLSGQVQFKHGDATQMPFPAGSFDVVWTQHSSMNMPDKAALYAEAHRVLRPGGRLAIHEVMAGPVTPLHFPVPWAKDAAISFVETPAVMRALIEQSGFREAAWVDVSEAATGGWAGAIASVSAPGGPPPLGLHLFLGPGTGELFQNLWRNLEEGRVVVVQAVFDKA